MKTSGFGFGHVGQRRKENQDSWLCDDQFGLYAVADGVGGHSDGARAGRVALSAFADAVRAAAPLIEKARAGSEHPRRLARLLDRATSQADERLKALQREERSDMGSTLTALFVVGSTGVMAHVGDSRLYVLRGGQLHQLSQDQTVAAELVREGVLSPESLEKSPYRHTLSQAMGGVTGVRAEVLRFTVLPGDRFLLCSDGLSNEVPAERLQSALEEEDLEGVPADLVEAANAAGGKDNVSVVVVDVSAEPGPEAKERAQQAAARLEAWGQCILTERLSLSRQIRVLGQCEVRQHEKGEAVQRAGETLAGLTIVSAGRLKVDGGGPLGPGEHYGLATLARPRPARAEVVAAESSETLVLTPAALRELVRARPRLGAILQRRLSEALAEALEARIATESAPHSRWLV